MYQVPFPSLMPALSGTRARPESNVDDEFINMVKDIRNAIFRLMRKDPESTEVIPYGQDKQLEKDLNTYLKIYKGMTRNNDLRKQKLVARLSRRCWQIVLMIEGNSALEFSRSGKLTTYSFKWLTAHMPEDEVYRNLIALEKGEMDVKKLNSCYAKNASGSTSGHDSDDLNSCTCECGAKSEWEKEKEEMLKKLEAVTEQLENERTDSREKRLLNKKEALRWQQKIDSLEQQLEDEKRTVANLRTSLSKAITEKNSLREMLDSQTTSNQLSSESLTKKIEDLKAKINSLKENFAVQGSEETLREELGKEVAEPVFETEELMVKSSLEVKKTKKQSTWGAQETSTREVKIEGGASLLIEELSFLPKRQVSKQKEKMPMEEKKEAVVQMKPQPQEKKLHNKRNDPAKKEVNDKDKTPGAKKICVKDISKQGRFVAVAYTDCKAFFIGKVVEEEGNVLSVSFLNGKPKKGTYEWPKEVCVQNIYSHQIFMDNVKPVDEPPRFLKFPTICPSDPHFQHTLKNCREQLEKIERKSCVEKVWSDIEAPHRKIGKVSWSSLKSLQLNMPPQDEALMITIMDCEWQPGWLNDEVIDEYMAILESRANKKGQRVLTANTRFFDVIRENKNWRRKLHIDKYRKLVFPGQFGSRCHWKLGIVDIKNGTISLVDPLKAVVTDDNERFFETVRTFLCQRGLDKKWEAKKITHPFQSDAVSCGVYVLKIAECILNDDNVVFDKEQIDEYRYDIAAEFLKEK